MNMDDLWPTKNQMTLWQHYFGLNVAALLAVTVQATGLEGDIEAVDICTVAATVTSAMIETVKEEGK